MKIVIYREINKYLLEKWKNLWEESKNSNYFNSPEWFVSSLKAFNYKKYIIFCVFKNGRLIGLIPLVEKKKYGLNVFCISGDFICGSPFLAKANTQGVIKILTKSLLDIGICFLDGIPEKYLSFEDKSFQKNNSILAGKNYYLILKKDANGKVIFENRNKLMRKIKKIESRFMLKKYSGFSKQVFKTVLDIDKNSSKSKDGYNAFADKSVIKFYKLLASSLNGGFITHILYFDGKPVVYTLGFVINDIYYASQTAFLDDYKRYTPGKALTVKIVESFSDDGINTLDLGYGEGYFKRSISQDFNNVYTIILTKNVLVKNYLKSLSLTKNMLYRNMNKKPMIYSIYRRTFRTMSRLVR